MKVKDFHVYDKYSNTYGYLYVFECESDKQKTFYSMSHVFTKKKMQLGKMQLYTFFKNKDQLTCIIHNNRGNFNKVALTAVEAADIYETKNKQPSLFDNFLKKLRNCLKRS